MASGMALACQASGVSRRRGSDAGVRRRRHHGGLRARRHGAAAAAPVSGRGSPGDACTSRTRRAANGPAWWRRAGSTTGSGSTGRSSHLGQLLRKRHRHERDRARAAGRPPRHAAVSSRCLARRPIAGRVFTAEEEQASGPGAAVISDGFWARRFQRRPDAIGHALMIGGRRFEIVGVMPRDVCHARRSTCGCRRKSRRACWRFARRDSSAASGGSGPTSRSRRARAISCRCRKRSGASFPGPMRVGPLKCARSRTRGSAMRAAGWCSCSAPSPRSGSSPWRMSPGSPSCRSAAGRASLRSARPSARRAAA